VLSIGNKTNDLRWPWIDLDPPLCVLNYIAHMAFGAHHKIWPKIDPYYQQQKCSPRISVSSKITFMQIFAGVRWRGGVKWKWGHQKWRTFTSKATIFILCYVSLSRSSMASKQMTLNDPEWPFCVKICFGLGN